jgi:hypothetical protein
MIEFSRMDLKGALFAKSPTLWVYSFLLIDENDTGFQSPPNTFFSPYLSEIMSLSPYSWL